MTAQDARDQLIAELESQVDMLLGHNTELIHMLQVQEEHGRLTTETAVLRAETKLALEHGDQLRKVRNVLQNSLVALKMAREARGKAKTQALNDLEHKVEQLSGLVKTSLDGGYERPFLLDVLSEWIEIRGNLGIDPKKITTDKNRISDFVAFAGNRPLNKYRFFDFQRFASMLVYVPASYTKMRKLKHLSQAEVSDMNKEAPPGQRLESLTAKTIDTNYLSPLRMFFKDVAAQYEFRSPLENVEITISGSAKGSVERTPFEVHELNAWFAFAANEDRADAKWLPLLGTLTGARIGELICLQGKDIYLMAPKIGEANGHWVVDLRTEMIAENGGEEKRRLKTKSSRRLIALHNILIETGFIEYAKSRRDEEWIFPAAFYHGKTRVKSPADAASKRMNRQLKTVGIHKEFKSTFHSTRHTAKDFMRMAKVDERTHDKQTGHSLGSVSRRYGAKHLVGSELDVLVALPLPTGLDFSPYKNGK